MQFYRSKTGLLWWPSGYNTQLAMLGAVFSSPGVVGVLFVQMFSCSSERIKESLKKDLFNAPRQYNQTSLGVYRAHHKTNQITI